MFYASESAELVHALIFLDSGDDYKQVPQGEYQYREEKEDTNFVVDEQCGRYGKGRKEGTQAKAKQKGLTRPTQQTGEEERAARNPHWLRSTKPVAAAAQRTALVRDPRIQCTRKRERRGHHESSRSSQIAMPIAKAPKPLSSSSSESSHSLC
ncbi:hypothetical protein SUGI_0608830 [Cryptomeria japonica]|nr:hypothetical protein SUGI_0608830 [Cryptomeria japonica]